MFLPVLETFLKVLNALHGATHTTSALIKTLTMHFELKKTYINQNTKI